MKNSISASQLHETIEHENEHWSKIFDDERQKINHKPYSSYWWEDYYIQITDIVKSRVKHGSSVIEIGAGSGKASLLLGNQYSKHLLDVSPAALEFAKYLANRLKAKNIKFILGNGFDTKLPNKSYDLVWNIGVVEHYSRKQAILLITEMIRLTKNGGYLAIAVPNFQSFHIMWARILNKPILKNIPGYRLDSERNYTELDIQDFISKSCDALGREIDPFESFSVGNPLPMGSPKIIINTIGHPLNLIFKKNRHLLIVIVRLK